MKIKTSVTVTEISGKLGGHVAQQSNNVQVLRSNYARRKIQPLLVMPERSRLTSIAKAYHKLSPSVKQQYINLYNYCVSLHGASNPVLCSFYNLFLKYNTLYCITANGVATSIPLNRAYTPLNSILCTVYANPRSFIIAFSPNPSPAGLHMLYISDMALSKAEIKHNSMRYFGAVASGRFSPVTNITTLPILFPIPIRTGLHYCVEYRYFNYVDPLSIKVIRFYGITV